MKLLTLVSVFVTGLLCFFDSNAQRDNASNGATDLISISGIIKDETEQPIPGVSITQDKKVLGLSKSDGSFQVLLVMMV